MEKKVPCRRIVLILLLSEQVKLHFFTSSTVSRNGEILFTVEASGPKVGLLTAQHQKESGREPVASQHCLFTATCCAQSRGRKLQIDAAVPWASGRWRATRPRGPPALRDSLSLCGKPELRNKGKCSASLLSPNPPYKFHYSWMKSNPLITAFTPAVITVQEAPQKPAKVVLLHSLVKSLVSHHIVKS